MELKDIIAKYRQENGLSKREFGRKCEVSNAYISILETGVHPKTKKKLIPTFPMLQKIAKGMGISFNDLIEMMGNDEAISLRTDMQEDIDAIASEYTRLLSDGIKKAVANDCDIYKLSQIMNICADCSDEQLDKILKMIQLMI